MSRKWKVFSEDRVYGHYTGKTPEEAAKKAMKKNYSFHPEIAMGVSVVKSGDCTAKVVEVSL